MARHYFNTVENSVTGKPVNGATIEVLSSALAYVTIYSDDGTTTIDQSASPLTSDSTGFFEFWTNETSGTVRISYDGEVKRTISDVEFPDGAVTGDVSALAARMDAAEVITQDPLIVDIAALSDPGADRILFWDDSVGDIGWLAASTGLTITGTNMTVDPVAAAGLADPNADRIRFWDDSAGAEAWLVPSTGIVITGTNLTVDEATTAQYRANTADKFLSTDQTWAAAAYVALTDAATVDVDMSLGFNFSLTIGGNRTLGAPTNTKDGQTGAIVITQDGTGSRTLAYHANWKFAGGTDPTLSTAAGAVDVLFYQVISSTSIIGNLVKAIA